MAQNPNSPWDDGANQAPQGSKSDAAIAPTEPTRPRGTKPLVPGEPVPQDKVSSETATDLVLKGFLTTFEDYQKTATFSSVVLPALALMLLRRRHNRVDHKRVVVNLK